MTWNDKKQTLTIDARKGSFDDMLQRRTFKVVLPNGQSKEVTYTGKKLNINF